MNDQHRRVEPSHLVFHAGIEKTLIALADRTEHNLVAWELIQRLTVEHSRTLAVGELRSPHEPEKPFGGVGVAAAEAFLKPRELGSLVVGQSRVPPALGIFLPAPVQARPGEIDDPSVLSGCRKA